jgi:hypothetical protein
MTTRSSPWTTTTGSDTPVAFTRRSMMSFRTLSASRVGATPSLGRAWYSTRSPPSRSRPSLVSIVRHAPSGAVGSGILRLGKKTTISERMPIRAMRKGPALRIGGMLHERPP